MTAGAFFLLLLAGSPPSSASGEPSGFAGWLAGIPERFIRRIRAPRTTLDAPEKLEQFLAEVKAETFNGNEVKRDEEVDITRPLKQTGLSLMDEQIRVIKAFLAYRAATLVRQAASPAVSKALRTARALVGRLGTGRAGAYDRNLTRSGFGRKLVQNLGASSSRSFFRREGNFVLMALITVLIDSGFYDGLDIDSTKDRVDAAVALAVDHTYDRSVPGTMILAEFVNREAYRAFEKQWETIYRSALSDRGGFGRWLRKADDVVGAAGQRLFRANRVRAGPGATGAGGFGKSIGLVGIEEGIGLTLSGLAGRVFIGAGMATAGTLAIDAAAGIIEGLPNRTFIGGQRNRYYGRAEANDFQLLRTGNKLRDFWHERSIVLRDLWDDMVKWPVRTVLGPTTALLGAYLGSVAAGALFAGGRLAPMIGGTLVSSLFAGLGMYVGNWLATKIDRGQAVMSLRRAGYRRMVAREIREMPEFGDGRIAPADVGALAEARALDFEKIESQGRSPTRFHIVNSLDNVRVEVRGAYPHMVIDDADGSRFDAVANIRDNVLDLEGRRALFDIGQGRMVAVGRVAENNGRDIVFIDSDHLLVEDGRIVNRKDRGVYVLDNGTILELKRRDPLAIDPAERAGLDAQAEQWVVRGHAASRDIFSRQTGERFAWDGEAYRLVTVVGAPPTPPPGPGTDPLDPFQEVLDRASGGAGRASLLAVSRAIAGRTRSSLESSLAAVETPAGLDALLDSWGLGGVDLPARRHLDSFETMEDRRGFIRTRVDRQVERLGTAIGRDLMDLGDGDLSPVLRAARSIPWRDRDDHDPVQRLSRIRDRVEAAPLGGRLTLLASPGAVAATALLGPDPERDPMDQSGDR